MITLKKQAENFAVTEKRMVAMSKSSLEHTESVNLYSHAQSVTVKKNSDGGLVKSNEK